jgi:hypothetical protein
MVKRYLILNQLSESKLRQSYHINYVVLDMCLDIFRTFLYHILLSDLTFNVFNV